MSSSFSPIQINDEIIWNANTKITWEDFQGNPGRSSNHDAVSNVGISYTCTPFGDSVKINVIAIFHKKKSWVKESGKGRGLEHEQGHFDIAEIFARKLRKELSEQKYKKKTVTNHVSQMVAKYNKLLSAEQDMYDNQTNHSINEEQQKEWLDKIKKELQELDAYSSPVIKKSLKG